MEYKGKKTAVTMLKCEIRSGCHDGDRLNVHLKNTTEVIKSEKKFDVSKERMQKDEVMDIGSVEDLVQYQQVTVEGMSSNAIEWHKEILKVEYGLCHTRV